MTLHCEQVPYPRLAEEFGTPLYVYSQSALTEAFENYQTAFAALSPLVCYAVKANGNLSIIKHFALLGSGFDIVSGGELARVLAAGGDAAKTIFSGVGKSEAEIEFALHAGVKCFNMESIPEIDRIQKVAERLGKTASVSLRVNPDVDAKTHPYISTGLKANKFGIAYADALEAYRHAARQSHLKIIGIDCHIGSQLTDLSPLIEACERILIFEFVKHGEEKNFVMVDAAMNDLMRPALYDAYHHIEAVEPKNIPSLTANIVGPICETGDFLGKDRTLACEEGDLLVIRSAGAYGASMASNYNTRNRAAEVLVDGNEYRLIRRRETLEQQMANEMACL